MALNPRFIICDILLGHRSYPLPAPPADPSVLGVNIQRTMALLSQSSREDRKTVQVLVYGQLIAKDQWSREIARYLRDKYPQANLLIENRSIGGCASTCLIAPAEHDLYPFYPDLLIFHVQGSHIDYDKLIRKVRETTTAEVLLLTDHYTGPSAWSDRMSYELIPEIARKYKCAVVDIRRPWLRYLEKHFYSTSDLLSDGIHLNAQGNFLMAELIKPYLVYRPELVSDPDGLVKTYDINKDIAVENGKLTLAFEGNRIDVIASKDKTRGGSGDGSHRRAQTERVSRTLHHNQTKR